MTATYSSSGSNRDQVRRLIGDTDITSPRFSDEEIDAELTVAGGVYSAAANLAESLGAKYATQVDLSVDGFSVGNSKASEAFFKLSNRLRAEAPLKDAGGLGSPFVGGVSLSEIEAVADNEDRTPSAFTHDMLENHPINNLTDGNH